MTTKLVTLTLLLSSTLCQAKICNLTNDFTPEALSALNTARNKKINGLMRLVSTREFEIQIMHSERLGKYITMLGEIHIKNKKSSQIGKAVITQFKHKFFELVPPREIGSFNPIEELGLLTSRLISLRFSASTIRDTIYDARTIWLGEPGKIILAKNQKLPYQQPIYTPEEVVQAVDHLKATKPTDRYNLPLEAGTEYKPNANDSYILDERNDRMTNSMLYYLNHLQEVTSPLAIVGMAHIEGLTERLERDSDFEICENF